MQPLSLSNGAHQAFNYKLVLIKTGFVDTLTLAVITWSATLILQQQKACPQKPSTVFTEPNAHSFFLSFFFIFGPGM